MHKPYNHDPVLNISEFHKGLAQASYATSKTELDTQYKKLCKRIVSRVANNLWLKVFWLKIYDLKSRNCIGTQSSAQSHIQKEDIKVFRSSLTFFNFLIFPKIFEQDCSEIFQLKMLRVLYYPYFFKVVVP